MGVVFKDTIKLKRGRFVVPKNAKTGKFIATIEEMQKAEDQGCLIQEMVTTSDTRHFFTQGVNDYFMKPPEDADEQWKELFYEMPSSGDGELFPTRSVNVAGEGSHGIQFTEVGEGGEIQFSTVESAEKFIRNLKWATALGITQEWIEDGKMNLIEMYLQDFREAAYDALASIHYNIIIQAIATGVSRSAAVLGGTLDDFIASINEHVAVMRRNKATPKYICGAPEQESIIEQALKDVYRDDTITKSAKRLKPLISDFFPDGTVYLVQPKKWLVSTNRLGLTLGEFDDLLRDAKVIVGKFRRGAMLGRGEAIRAITGL